MDYQMVAKWLPDDVGQWSFELSDDGEFMFEAHSPLGEDVVIEGECESPDSAVSDIAARVGKSVDDFDIDEHVDLWAQHRGDNGVPDSYAKLLEDASAIESMVVDLHVEVSRWSDVRETDVLRCPVCGEQFARGFSDGIVVADDGGGKFVEVYECPTCFYSGTAYDIGVFWGFGREYREKLRNSMLRMYETVLRERYEEACDD